VQSLSLKSDEINENKKFISFLREKEEKQQQENFLLKSNENFSWHQFSTHISTLIFPPH
jgi:hypothetical protein